MTGENLGAPENECDIDAGSIAAPMEEFDQIFGNITGRSGEYNLITEPIGLDFSGLIAENLRSAAIENREAWETSLSACLCAYGVLGKVRKAVLSYDEKIEDIRSRYNGYIKSIGDVYPENFKTVVQTYHNEAEAAMKTLRRRFDSAEDMLSEGPTPETMRALAEAGHFGDNIQIGYQVTSDIDYYIYNEVDGVTAANAIKESAVNGYDGALESQLALVNALLLRGIDAQQNGGKLSKQERDFLEAFFNELEIEEGQAAQRRGESTPQEFLDFLDSVNESEHLDEETREAIKEALSGATMIASDEKIGGGYSYVPDDVREVIEGPDLSDVDSESQWLLSENYEEWNDRFEDLNDFFSYAGEDVTAGAEMGANIAATTGRMMDILGPSGENAPRDEVYQDMLNIATRNPETGNILITGENFNGDDISFSGRNSNASHEDILESILTHTWNDDGAAARGITDWISEFRSSGDQDQAEKAGIAADRLIDIITQGMDEDGEDAPFADTGIRVELEADPDDENKEKIEIDAPFTLLNPEFADSLTDIYIAFIDDLTLSDESGPGYSKVPDGPSLFHDPGDMALLLSSDDRENFFRLIMGEENAAVRAIVATEAQERRIIEETFINPDITPSAGAGMSAELRESLSDAVITEYTERMGNIEDARDSANKLWEAGYGVFSAVASNLAGDGKFAPAAVDILLEILKIPYDELAEKEIQEAIPDTYMLEDENGKPTPVKDLILEDDASEKEHVMLTMANVFAETGALDMEELEDAGLLVEDVNGNMHLPISSVEWGAQSHTNLGALEKMLRSADHGDGEGLSEDGKQDFDDYVNNWMNVYSPGGRINELGG